MSSVLMFSPDSHAALNTQGTLSAVRMGPEVLAFGHADPGLPAYDRYTGGKWSQSLFQLPTPHNGDGILPKGAAPAAAAAPGILVVAYRGADGLLRIRTSADAVGWSDEIAPPGIAIIAGDPEIIFSGGGSSSFLCAVSPSDQSRVSFYSVSTDGTAEPLSDLKVSTPSRVALVTWDGRLWCVYSDAGNNLELGIAVSDDVGQTWTIGDPLGFGPVLGAPALAVVGSQLLCLWTDQEFGAWPVMMATAVPGEPMPTWTAASNLDPDSSHRSMSGPSAANIGANSIMCVYASGSDDRDVWWTLGSFVVPGP